MADVAEVVHLAVHRGTATVTLDSPTNRNALSARLRAELRDALHRSTDDAVRVVVLDHTGPVFCSGMDLKEPGDAGVAEFTAILTQLWTHPKPVIAKLAGPARAGGIGLVAAADIAVAAHGATFAFTEVRLGLVPAVISVAVLPHLAPRAAQELLLTGETFDATRAAAIGLLTSAVPAAQLDAEVARYTELLLKGAPQALALTKQLLRRQHAPAMAEDLTMMCQLSAERFSSAEGREGIRAFAEKRPASWVPGN
ncbi:MAG TPA: enoyl-CoA hydratase-related protein [Pseudonocardiaceae bacterium]|jgi:methylglutaconyl-CoA hydratase|nr:enoyl-CoA hydratase-related protein [Pseudonocardiaceae bacterium]